MTYRLSPHLRPGRRGALGATPTASGDARVRALQQQVNRFVPSVLVTPLPVTGVMDYPTAVYAARVLYDRARRALDTFGPTEADNGPYHKAFAEAQLHLTAPLPWVPDHLAAVTQEVANYGDFLGLPPASGLITRLVSDWRVWVAAGGVGVLVLGRRRRR